MDEELYRLVSTGLLGLIVLLLIVAIARLGRLRRETSGQTTSPKSTAADGDDRSEAEGEPEPPSPGKETDGGAGETITTDEEDGPFERDGRWWYRREDELLVYDESPEQWVDANAPEAKSPPTEAGDAEPTVVPGAEPGGVAVVDSPDASHPLDEAKGWDASPSTFAPIKEPVSPPEPITEVQPEQAAAEPEPATSESGSHWKCPACGVINGSTATSCRMCFAARP